MHLLAPVIVTSLNLSFKSPWSPIISTIFKGSDGSTFKSGSPGATFGIAAWADLIMQLLSVLLHGVMKGAEKIFNTLVVSKCSVAPLYVVL